MPAVALSPTGTGGTICYELLSNSKIELPPYLAVFHANSWRADMIDVFHDYKCSTPHSGSVDQWTLVLDPRQQQSQRWKAGELSHLEMEEVIHEMYKAAARLRPICEQA